MRKLLRLKFKPIFWDALKGYNFSTLQADISAGLTVAIIALPTSMALGVSSGLTPGIGLTTSIVAGFFAAFFGGSKYQVTGPTAAFVAIVYRIVIDYGPESLVICVILAGFWLVLMGLLKLGDFMKFIPYPVVMGVTSGIAVILFLSQVKDFLGITVGNFPSNPLGQLQYYCLYFKEINFGALALGSFSILLMVFWPKKFFSRIPSSLIAIVLLSFLTSHLEWPIQRIVDRYKEGVPSLLPAFCFPSISWETFVKLLPLSFTIAFLGGMESLLSAVVADSMAGDNHKSNQELIGQGIGNIAGALFGGMPATAALARTATNIRNGAKTPIAAMSHAGFLFLILFFAAPYANLIPMCILSAIMLIVAFNMFEWQEFTRFKEIPFSDYLVFITVFLVTVLLDIARAIQIGIVLAALLFVKKVIDVFHLSNLSQLNENPDEENADLLAIDCPPEVQIFRIQGPFFFGTVDKIETTLREIQETTKVMILVMDRVFELDLTALNYLEGLYIRLHKKQCRLIFCQVPYRTLKVLVGSKLIELIDNQNVTEHLEDAIQKAKTYLI